MKTINFGLVFSSWPSCGNARNRDSSPLSSRNMPSSLNLTNAGSDNNDDDDGHLHWPLQRQMHVVLATAV